MKELGMKEGFDVCLEMSGNPKAFADMLDVMFYGGKIAMLGIMPCNARDRLEYCRLPQPDAAKEFTDAKCSRPGTK